MRGKYDAWIKNRGLSQAEAETKYIEAVHYIDPEFQSSTQWQEIHTGGAPNWGSVKRSGDDGGSPRKRGSSRTMSDDENIEDEDGEDDEALLHIVWRRMLKGKSSPSLSFNLNRSHRHKRELGSRHTSAQRSFHRLTRTYTLAQTHSCVQVRFPLVCSFRA